MPTYKVKSLQELGKLMRKHQKQREQRIKKAVRKSVQRGAAYVRRNMPVAFGELRDDIGTTATQVVSDAPHSEAVELGSRPHWVPLEALIKWVRLRGAQGILSEKQIAYNARHQSTTADHARSVAAQLAAIRRGGLGHSGAEHSGAESNFSPVDAPVQIAKAIQLAIALGGTKPHWFMRDAVPEVMGFLDEELQQAVPDKD